MSRMTEERLAEIEELLRERWISNDTVREVVAEVRALRAEKEEPTTTGGAPLPESLRETDEGKLALIEANNRLLKENAELRAQLGECQMRLGEASGEALRLRAEKAERQEMLKHLRELTQEEDDQ